MESNESGESFADACQRARNLINKPQHYIGNNGLEAIEIIDAFDLDFRIGNAVYYLIRVFKKHSRVVDQISDLEKAIWFIKSKIDQLKNIIECQMK